MNDIKHIQPPRVVQEILNQTDNMGFQMAAEPLVGSLLRTLAASKPAGRFLELGTGTGVSAAWLLDGMDSKATLISVEHNQELIAIAKEHLGQDPRTTFHLQDAGAFLEYLSTTSQRFDLIFADTWAGKYTHFEQALQVLNPGGFYIIDDMLPQANWPEGHDLKVAKLLADLERCKDLLITKLSWASGVVIATKQ